MPLFKCSECGCAENTALCGYWSGYIYNGKPRELCSACDPQIGRWHGRFDKCAASEAGYLLASDGFLYTQEDVDGCFKHKFKNG